jgi:beta-lactamase class A
MPSTKQSNARRVPTPLAAGAVLTALALIWTIALDPSGVRAAPSGSPESTDQSDASDGKATRPPRYTPGVRCVGLFNKAFTDEIAATHPAARFTAAVHDRRTGCRYKLNGGLEITTASVIKAQVLAGVLLAAQEAGRQFSESEAADVELMMHYSHNRPPTSRLYLQLGGAAGMEALDERFGIVGTSHTAWYGRTLSTAEDRTRLVEQLLIGGGPLSAESVQAAWEWMSSVSAAQSWGVTAGLPAGYEAALKNGFFPMSGAGWRLGTTGVVRDPMGGSYAMTVMTDNNPSESAGIGLVEKIARHINAALTTGTPAERAVDLVECVEPPRGSSWSSVAEMLGGVDAVELRRLNGGEPTPLTGQRVCRG